MSTINANISDLFFNRDLSACKVYDRAGVFIGWDNEALEEEAKTMLSNFEGLGIISLPTAESVVVDFHERV